jgi:transglutaminase-like putative cysteine protease
MLIRYGYEMTFEVTQATPMVCLLTIHNERSGDIRRETFETTPEVPVSSYFDMFGNACRRFVVPPEGLTIMADGVIKDSGRHDPVVPDAPEVPVAQLPDECLVYLLGSRYSETDRLSQVAWDTFGNTPRGWARVQAICDFVHGHMEFGYKHERATRTAFDAFNEKVGVCRDFAHLAVTLTRCMNIPARYVNGYLGDIGVPAEPSPMDFSAWFEAYLGGRWYSFDARHNVPRIGRIVLARGRDATDIPLVHSFGRHTLKGFKVWTDDVTESAKA